MAGLADYGISAEMERRLAARGRRTLYIVGDTDTGKTTLAAALAVRLAAAGRIAAVDLDAGQATLGLPTTYAWRLCGTGPQPDGLFFLGSTSPSGRLDLAVAGAANTTRAARARAGKVVVDSCGLALGSAGREFHHAVIDAVRPDLVIAIQRGGELAGLLEPLERGGWPEVLRVAAPGGVVRRSRAIRRSYRARRFREYFKTAVETPLDLQRVGLLCPRADPVGRIASLRDRTGRDMALAIVRAIDPAGKTMTVLTPWPKAGAVRSVVLGAMRIARDGRQLARDV